MGATGKLIDYFMKVSDYGGIRTEIRGNRYICLEGCDGIIDYSQEEISVKAGKMNICLKGRNMRIDFYSAEGIVVEGVLNTVEYSYNF